MGINFDLIKRIISSDELCDKVNSTEYRSTYLNQIESYVLSLISDISNINSNMEYINRYLNKFVITNDSKEDIFFNIVLLKLYNLKIKNSDFLSILDSFKFDEVKELLMKKYDQIVINKGEVSESELIRMLSFYCYVVPDYILPNSYIDFLTYNLVSNDVSLSYELIVHFYKAFTLSFASSKDLNVIFEIHSSIVKNDPYYDNRKNLVVLYNQNISDNVNDVILSDIFYQIKYLYLLKSINSSSNKIYSFEQLKLVKEVCLKSILGDEFFDSKYGSISFSNELKEQSKYTVKSYYKKLGLSLDVIDSVDFSFDEDLSDLDDKAISIDVLFDLILKRENPNLLRGLIKSYPILSSEYRNDKKKSLLTLLLDIYKNRKLLNNFNKDLEWYKSKLGKDEDLVIIPKIEKLNDKISVCSSYINVMSSIINNGDMNSSDILRSISDLITYDTNDVMIKNDIFSIMNSVIPKKVSRLCRDRSLGYRDNLKKKVIKCYLDSMGLVRNNMDTIYFMKLYSTLEECIKVIDVN